MITLMIITLLTTGSWNHEILKFYDKSQCMIIKTKIVEKIKQANDLTLISDCGRGDEDAVFHVVSISKSIEQ